MFLAPIEQACDVEEDYVPAPVDIVLSNPAVELRQKGHSNPVLRAPKAADLVGLGPDRGFTRGWWVYWSDLTSAWHLVGDHRRELQAALEGLRRFPDNPQILATQVRALAALGRVEEMRRGVAASMNVPPMEGWAAADVLLLAAVELRAHGHAAAADTMLAQARDWLAARPPAEAASEAHQVRVALVAYTAGRLVDAQREFERLAARGGPGRSGSVGGAAVMGDAWDQMDYLGYVGAVAARQGNRDQALRVVQTLERVTRPYLFGRPTVWRARIAALLGERDGAVALLREAFAKGYPHAHALHTDLAFEALRDYPPFQELLRPKE